MAKLSELPKKTLNEHQRAVSAWTRLGRPAQQVDTFTPAEVSLLAALVAADDLAVDDFNAKIQQVAGKIFDDRKAKDDASLPEEATQ